MSDVRTLTMPCTAPEGTVGTAPGTVVEGNEVGERTGAIASHARVSLVDCVPSEPLTDASHSLEAGKRITLQSSGNVMRRGDRNNLPVVSSAIWVAVGIHPTCKAELRIKLELAQQTLEVVWGKLRVSVKLGDVGKGFPLHAV